MNFTVLLIITASIIIIGLLLRTNTVIETKLEEIRDLIKDKQDGQ